MPTRPRLYDELIQTHLDSHRQMVFVGGPRQVGKTTTCSRYATRRFNWDDPDDRGLLLGQSDALYAAAGMHELTPSPVVLFDELHKYPRWKQFLKGFFDRWEKQTGIIVTGSSRLDVYRRGGDSLMGRYFLYHMHPFSVAEIVSTQLPDANTILRPPSHISDEDWDALYAHGGFPEPFVTRTDQFSRRWQSLRSTQLVREDIRDLTAIQQLDQLESLVRILGHRSSHQLIFSNLASEVRVTIDTIRRWITTLCNMGLGFLVRPWHKNVSRSLRKEPKWFLRDWATLADPGERAETLVACHLLKAVDGWNDLGLGDFHLGYLRDRSRREVDFVVARDGQPWFIAEVKRSDTRLSPALTHFQQQTGAPYAFQIVLDGDPVDVNCFTHGPNPKHAERPLVVPARTLLSQLL
ncbi:MAG: ATP-binding protein [Phycisphaerales bacterium]|jgi:hypothetical protein|nr:ATP-binding protein [Phycisphaerales bacterium]